MDDCVKRKADMQHTRKTKSQKINKNSRGHARCIPAMIRKRPDSREEDLADFCKVEKEREYSYEAYDTGNRKRSCYGML